MFNEIMRNIFIGAGMFATAAGLSSSFLSTETQGHVLLYVVAPPALLMILIVMLFAPKLE